MNRAALLFLTGVVCVGAIAGIVTVSLYSGKKVASPRQYAVVIDAGSSHSEFFLYSWEPTKQNVSTDVVVVPNVDQQPFSCGTKHGISTFNNAHDASQSLHDCLTQAVNTVPEENRRYTSIHLRATAGMRVLNHNNRTLANAILDECRALFQSFDIDTTDVSAEIMSGKEEGAFGWITANYVDKRIAPSESSGNTTGALDLGGASTQITFGVKSTGVVPNKTDLFNLQLFSHEYHLYAHSYLCYGANAARDRSNALMASSLANPATPSNASISNPCFPQGYTTTIQSVDVSGLREDFCAGRYDIPSNITNLRLFGDSSGAGCDIVARTLVEDSTLFPGMGVDQPVIPNTPFFAFAGFFYTVDYLCRVRNVSGCVSTLNEGWHITPADLSNAAALVCAESWAEIKANSPNVSEKFLPNYCFQTKYIVSVLGAYNFSSSTDGIEFVGKVKGNDVGWTLGYLLWHATEEAGEPTHKFLRGSHFTTAVVLVAIVSCIALALLYVIQKQRRLHSSYESIVEEGNAEIVYAQY
eukprot:m.113585 g.113585  ORF g.113585 m.113585 type:complete len:527 (-) comp12799_c0_seq2:183-1763(-)